MSSSMSQSAWQKFLDESLSADTSASTEAEQELQAETQAKEFQAQIDATIEQAKASAMETGANLLGIGGIEAIRATKGLFTAGQGLYTRVKQMKDISQKIIAQKSARTAKIEDLKEQKYNEAVAKNAEIDPLTGAARGGAIDKVQFMKDADAAISKADTSAMISKVRNVVMEKASPYLDRINATADNLIEAVGSHADAAVSSLTDTVGSAASYVKNGFAQYTDTANALKSTYLDNFSKAQKWTDATLASNVAKGQSTLTKFANDTAAQGIEGLDEHISTIRDLMAQGTRQSVTQAQTLFGDLKSGVATLAPLQKIKKAQADIEAVKSNAVQMKSDVLNKLEDTRTATIDKVALAQQRLEKAKTLPETAPSFRNAGVTKSESLDSIQRDIDNHNLDLQTSITDAHAQLGDIDAAATAKLSGLSDTISAHADEIAEAAGGATTDLLTRVSSAASSAVSMASDAISSGVSALGKGISAAREAIAPATEALGVLLTPVAVWQGSLSAENLVKGNDNGNLENMASDAVNVRFGVGAAKAVVTKGVEFVKSAISGKPAGEATGEAAAEQEVEGIPKTEAEQASEALSENVGENVGKSAGTAAGEDIAGSLAEAGGEEVAEVGLGDLALNAVPVVGEIADVAMAGFALYEGFKNFFGGGDSSSAPPPVAPPPDITQSISFHSQAGVY